MSERDNPVWLWRCPCGRLLELVSKETQYGWDDGRRTQRNATQRNATQRNATQRNATQRNAELYHNLNVESRTLFIGDNLPILRGINSESIDLIATDPPFNKGVKAFEGIVTAGTDARGQKVSYKDVWTWGDVQSEWMESIREDHPNLYSVIQAANAAGGEDIGAFLCWLGVRALEMHRILKPTGSIYLHIDHTAHAWVKCMLDAVFGRERFRNEIVWCYPPTGQPPKASFPRKHDDILFYAKTNDAKFFTQYGPMTEATLRTYSSVDKDGRRYSKAHGGRTYLDELRGRAIPSWWDDCGSGSTMPVRERTGYPTQKPLALYERIIKASSNGGDVVLDPFAGCATTCIAAERLGREWIAIDINKEAEDVVVDRLQREAQLPSGASAWNRSVLVETEPPERTDGGEKAGPELALVSPKPKGPRMSIREIREELSEKHGCICQGCGYEPPGKLSEYLEVDHRKPKSRGGGDELSNRVLLCPPCNGVKSNKLSLSELRKRRVEEGRMVKSEWTMEWYEREGKFD